MPSPLWNASRWVLVLTVLAASIGPVHAQSSEGSTGDRSATAYRFSYTPIIQFAADLDSGGEFDVQRHFLRLDASRSIDRRWVVGIGLSFDYERWQFADVPGLSGVDPWDEIYRPGISLPIFYRSSANWRFGIVPSVEAAGASGAETDESLAYGTVLSAAYAVGPNLTLGLGGGIFRRLDETDAFPFVVIDWTINDRLSLRNPFQAGPVGPAGLELVYRRGDGLELGAGGAYRSYRFRLDDSSAIPDGIGEVDFWAPFLRVGWRLGDHYELDLHGGAQFGGRITIENADAHEVGATDYDPAPFLALTVRGRF